MWQESILLVGTAVVLALLIKTFLVQAFYIPPSGSMRDTLEDNDRILVQKVSYWFHDPQRGDIVVFDDPANWLGEEDGDVPTNVFTKSLSFLGLYPSGGHLVKRVIGVGGDHVACRRGSVSRQRRRAAGEAAMSPWPNSPVTDGGPSSSPPSTCGCSGTTGSTQPTPEPTWATREAGFVPVDDVVGKAFVVLWPLHRWQFIHRPATFDNPRLDQAASIISVSAPTGLTALAVPALYRRRKKRIAHR